MSTSFMKSRLERDSFEDTFQEGLMIECNLNFPDGIRHPLLVISLSKPQFVNYKELSQPNLLKSFGFPVAVLIKHFYRYDRTERLVFCG